MGVSFLATSNHNQETFKIFVIIFHFVAYSYLVCLWCLLICFFQNVCNTFVKLSYSMWYWITGKNRYLFLYPVIWYIDDALNRNRKCYTLQIWKKHLINLWENALIVIKSSTSFWYFFRWIIYYKVHDGLDFSGVGWNTFHFCCSWRLSWKVNRYKSSSYSNSLRNGEAKRYFSWLMTDSYDFSATPLSFHSSQRCLVWCKRSL